MKSKNGRINTRILLIIAKRFAQMLLTLFGAGIVVWCLLPLAPGDPAYRILVSQGNSDPSPLEIELKREELGLNRPYHEQYIDWLGKIVRGDFSESFQNGKPVLEELGKRLPATVRLAALALFLALVSSILFALIATAFHKKWPDRVILLGTQIFASTPSFIACILVLQFIVVKLGLGQVLSNGSSRFIIFPAICLSLSRAAGWTQILRAGLLGEIQSQYVLVATSRGASQSRTLFLYALPNALLPFLTVVGVGIGGIIGGAAIVEAIFTWPGIGSYVFNAILARDFPVVQGFVIIAGISYVLTSMLVDLTGILLNPRLREGSAV